MSQIELRENNFMSTPKCYSKKVSCFYIATNILILFAILILTIIYSNDSVEKDSVIGTINIVLTICFLVVNLSILFLYLSYRKRLYKKIKECADNKEYDRALNYLYRRCSHRHLYTNYQMILFFLAEFELLKGSNENAVFYLMKIDISKTSRINALMMVQTLLFVYLYGMYSHQDELLNLADKANHTKKFYMENFSKSRDIVECIEILDLFENGNVAYGIMKLKNSKYIKFPFIYDFCEQN